MYLPSNMKKKNAPATAVSSNLDHVGSGIKGHHWMFTASFAKATNTELMVPGPIFIKHLLPMKKSVSAGSKRF